ncbi:putative DNA primase [Serratia phage 4S]|nr:putative DNA primase [Serratia phage 4S]
MSYVDQEFAERVFSNLLKYRKVSGSTFKLNARCPICGDSHSDMNKARFWCYPFKDSLRVKCFNCDYSHWFNVFLKEEHPELYRDYLMEKRKEQMIFQKPVREVAKALKKEIIPVLNFSTRIDHLPVNHPIIKYVRARAIPEAKWDRLWFTYEWPKLCNSVNPGTYKNETNEPRLVIPIFNAEGKIESFQGRALRKDAPQKYITIKASEDSTKIYGLDTVKPNKMVYFTEGPLDSLFVDNGAAITGGSVDLASLPFTGNRAFIMDNEPRHPDTIKRMKKLLDAGEKIVLWDKCPWKAKDINEMITDCGATHEQVNQYIRDNTVHGLMAQLRFKTWAKC